MTCRQKLCKYFENHRLAASSVTTYCSNLILFVQFFFWLRETDMTADDHQQLLTEIGKWKQSFGGDVRCEQRKEKRKKGFCF